MKSRKTILWTVGLLIVACVLFFAISTGIESAKYNAKREATRVSKQTVFAAESVQKTQLALTPTPAPITDLALACQTGEKASVAIEGKIEPAFLVVSKPDYTRENDVVFESSSFFLVAGDEKVGLHGLSVCADGYYKSCLRMPKKDFKPEDISGYTADDEQFFYGDTVTVTGLVWLQTNDDGSSTCLISVQSIQ